MSKESTTKLGAALERDSGEFSFRSFSFEVINVVWTLLATYWAGGVLDFRTVFTFWMREYVVVAISTFLGVEGALCFETLHFCGVEGALRFEILRLKCP